MFEYTIWAIVIIAFFIISSTIFSEIQNNLYVSNNTLFDKIEKKSEKNNNYFKKIQKIKKNIDHMHQKIIDLSSQIQDEYCIQIEIDQSLDKTVEVPKELLEKIRLQVEKYDK